VHVVVFFIFLLMASVSALPPKADTNAVGWRGS
jgi:hypothetical protein